MKKNKVIYEMREGVILGKGSSGYIYKIKNDDYEYALKKIKITPKGYESSMEVIASSILDRGICPVTDVEYAPEGIYLYMPVATSSLKDYKLNSNKLWEYSEILLDHLDYIHSQKIIHGDIKPSNILVMNKTPVFSDFGSSIYNINCLLEIPRYTKHYRAPEVWDCEWDQKADFWALGCTLFELGFSKLPIVFKNNPDKFLENWFYNPPPELDRDTEFSNLLKNLLDPDPHKRYSINTKEKFKEKITLQESLDFLPEDIMTNEKILARSKILGFNFTEKVRTYQLLEEERKIIQKIIEET